VKLRLTVAYDGRDFSGWQSQKDGNAVQDHIERAFRCLCPGRTVVHGAGRTDSGVHANGQCAHAEVPDDRLPAFQWAPALNAHLPGGIRIMRAEEAPVEFHARFSARGKTYQYTVWNGPVLPPHDRGRAWHVVWRLDDSTMAAACALFEGTHDFAAYSAKRSKAAERTVRTVSSIRFHREGERVTLTFSGEGFLYKMVRMLSAAVVRCAAGKILLADLALPLHEGQPRFSHVAPAEGLNLLEVSY